MNLALKNRLALLRRVHGCPGCGATPFSSIVHRPSSIDFSASDVDLLYAIGLPPEQAIEYFKSKGYAYSWDWQEIWQEAQSLSFTVAKAMRLDVLQTIRDELQKALDDGMMLRDFQKNLEPKLKALGWWGKSEIIDADGVVSSVQLGSAWRLQTIYDTNMSTSYMSGRWKEYMENTDDRPWFQYVAVMDSKTRPSHAALNGKVFRYDDPFWDSFWPPNDWG
ncbi:MAG: phage minor head protein [Nitrospirae bacterium]|nr:phage minor head protein [Nitrospirota bacterium]